MPRFPLRRCDAEHGLDTIAGYRLRQTQIEGEWVGADGPVIAELPGAGRYGEALERVRAVRSRPNTYAVIDIAYACGCTGIA